MKKRRLTNVGFTERQVCLIVDFAEAFNFDITHITRIEDMSECRLYPVKLETFLTPTRLTWFGEAGLFVGFNYDFADGVYYIFITAFN